MITAILLLGLIGLNPGRPFVVNGSLISRSVVQDGGDWVVDYKIRTGRRMIDPTETGYTVDGEVYNTILVNHGLVRPVNMTGGPRSSYGVVIANPDDNQACHLKVNVQCWAVGTPGPSPRNFTASGRYDDVVHRFPAWQDVWVRLRLEHDHHLYRYDPLLGRYQVRLIVAGMSIADVIDEPAVHERYFPTVALQGIADDRLDYETFMTKPHSLLLTAAIPGNHYYRMGEIPVRSGEVYRLSYWYCVARGSEGPLRTHLSQYSDAPSGWQVVHDGADEWDGTVVDRWTHVVRHLHINPITTSIAIDFRILGADEVGDIWIDDITLEPVNKPRQTP